MSSILINGEKKLSGSVDIQGSKNSALPILAATILCDNQTIVHNCPLLSDVVDALEILRSLGFKAAYNGETAVISGGNLTKAEIPEHLMRKMRSSIMFLGPILGRLGRAKISLPGGCELGPRPIDLHLSALSKMGVHISDEYGFLNCYAKEGLIGATINLDFPSVGATENVIMAAVLAKGTTIINNAAREPEIVDLADFLNKMGANIKGAGGDTIEIQGVRKLFSCEYSIMPDRIVAATYLCAIAITRGAGRITKVNPAHLSSFLSLISDCNIKLRVNSDSVEILDSSIQNGIRNIRTMPYPGFPTDIQAPLMALLTRADGDSVFVETIFENRYKHVTELCRLGAKIKVDGRIAIVTGVKKLTGSTVEATDLRGGAALVVAGLAAKGETKIEKVFHIERGYDRIDKNLQQLGADIKLISTNPK